MTLSSTNTPEAKYRWTEDRTAAVVDGWRAGRRVQDIAKSIGATRNMVINKARRLRLGNHQNAYVRPPDGLHGGLASSVRAGEESRPVRMPVVGFQDRRLSGEDRW